MKKLLFIFCLVFCFSFSNAQSTSFFEEDFHDNHNNWLSAVIKKSHAFIDADHYTIYNDEGKSPIISLIELPFNRNKNYEISTALYPEYISNNDLGWYGMMFAAKDEKNGYAVLLDYYNRFRFVKFENGKQNILFESRNTGADVKGGNIYATLTDWQWKFTVNGTELYSTDALPWLGNKVGVYVAEYGGCSYTRLSIDESSPLPFVLPINRETFSQQFSNIMCYAYDDFSKVKGDSTNTLGIATWHNLKGAPIDGASGTYMLKYPDNMNMHSKGKDFIIELKYKDSTNLEASERLFYEVVKAVSSAHSLCAHLAPADIMYNPGEDMIKDALWDADKETTNGKLLEVELVLHKNISSTTYYSLLLHVYLKK